METNPADVAGVRIRYGLQSAKYTLALSSLQLLLSNVQRGCSILSGLRAWEWSPRPTDTWASNTPCWASLCELGWEGCANEEIMVFSCGLTTPEPPAAPPQQPPSPPRNGDPLSCPPPKPTKSKKRPADERKCF